MKRALFAILLLFLLCGCSGDPDTTSEAGSTPPSSLAGNNTPPADSGSGPAEPNEPGSEADEGESASETASNARKGGESTNGAKAADRDESIDSEDNPVAAAPPPMRPRGDLTGLPDNHSEDESDDGSDEEVASDDPGGGDSSLVAAFPKPGFRIGFADGELVPEIVGKDTEGTEFRLSEYKEKVIMLDFWGDW